MIPQRPITFTPTTAPSGLPVTLEEFKVHGRIDHDYEDNLILQYLADATNGVEIETGMALASRPVTAYFRCWSRYLELPRPPLASVQFVRYTDRDGVLQTIDAAEYSVLTEHRPGLVEFVDNFNFPQLDETLNPIRVEYTAGFASVADVPAQAKTAIFLMAEHRMEFREVAISGTVATPIPRSYRSLIESLREVIVT